MLNKNTDKEWEKFGKHDPYFGVLTHEKFQKTNMTEQNREEFFATGEHYIDHVQAKIRRHIDPNFEIGRALDFGCGVGRLVIPLASIAHEVTGVDVSSSMLREAQVNCDARKIGNVLFAKSDDDLSSIKGKFNFVHSTLVFQHIPVRRGEIIFKNLIKHLDDNGVCVLQFTYGKETLLRKLIPLIKRYIPLSSNIANLLKGRKFSFPQMEMNAYDLNRLFLAMQNANVHRCHTEFTRGGGELGVVLYFQKP